MQIQDSILNLHKNISPNHDQDTVRQLSRAKSPTAPFIKAELAR